MKSRFMLVGFVALLGLGITLALPQRAPAAPAPTGPSGPATAPGTGPYQLDTTHSSVIYRIRHNDVSYFYGRFNNITGAIDYDAAKPAAGSVQLTIETASVDSKNTKRDDDLRSPSFFNAVQFPEITFKSTSAKKVSADTVDVTGDLNLHGVTKSVMLRVKRTGALTSQSGRQLVGFETTFTIKRSDYGITYMLDRGLGDEVTVTVSIEARR